MWKNKELKRRSRCTLKKNYWRIVIVCMLAAFIMSGSNALVSSNSPIKASNMERAAVEVVQPDKLDVKSNSDIVDEFLTGIQADKLDKNHYTRGVLSVFANNVEGADSFVFGLLNAFNQIAFHDRINAGVIIFAGTGIYLLYWFFICSVIMVGQCRFFMEARLYPETQLGRLLFSYRVRRGVHTAWVIFVQKLYLFFWTLTIAGGFVKRYSYMMTPYIIAENPQLSASEAIRLSKSMMKGHKWKAFLLDVSFIGWGLLGFITLGLVKVLYLDPYRQGVYCELYMELRRQAKEKSLAGTDRLCDFYLDDAGEFTEYPDENYILPMPENRKWLRVDYKRDYSILNLVLIFFVFAFVGWLWEVSLHLMSDGVFVNRGVMIGPWLPIYGTGGAIALVALKKTREKPLLTFFSMMVLAGIVEYSTSWYLEFSKGMKWWDYSGYFMNLNGRICMEGLLIFGLAGCAAIYIVGPLLDELLNKIPKKTRIGIAAALVCLFGADSAYSHIHPNTGKGITDY